MTASPDGTHATAGAKVGYLMSLAALKFGPILAVDYAHAKVDSYTESGDPALTLNVSSQSFKSLTGDAGVEARGDLAGLHAFVDAAVEHEFSGDGRLIHFSQTSAPIIVNHWNVAARKQTYGRISGGASAELVPGMGINVSASSTVGRDHGQEFGGQVGIKAAF
jgi:outer membrane autotransporter protein